MECYKIGFALPSLHDHGGVNKAVMHLTDALREMGHEVHLFPFGAGQKKIDMYHHPINSDDVDKQCSEFDYCYKKAIEEGPFNLFVANTLPTHTACILSEVDSLVCCFHQSHLLYDEPHSLYGSMFNLLKKRGTIKQFRRTHYIIKEFRKTYNNSRIIWVGKNVGDIFIKRYGIKPSLYKVIPNGLNIAKIKKLAREKIPTKRISPFILSVGRLSKEKNIPLLINAYASFVDKYHLVILGEGKEKENIKCLVNKLSLADKVHFIDWVDNSFAWIKQASLCVSTSNWETCPMNVIESLIIGTPMVSTDNLGGQEILTGELNKYLTPRNKLDPLVNKMQEGLNYYPQVRTKFITKYDNYNVAQEYLKLINSNMKGKYSLLNMRKSILCR